MKKSLLIALGALSFSAASHAATYTDSASFAAALVSPTTADFNALGNAFFGGPGFGGTGTVTYDGVTVTTSTSYLFSQATDTYGTGTFLSVQQVAPPVFTISFGSAMRAVGFNYDSSDPLSLVVNGETFNIAASPFPALSFFGLTSDTSFTSVTLSTTGGGVDLDNVIFAGAAVPEPATWAMMIVGFFASGHVMRRRHDKRVSSLS